MEDDTKQVERMPEETSPEETRPEEARPEEAKPTEMEHADNHEKKGGVGVIILNILLALITILLIGYIAYRNGYINLDNILNVKENNSSEDVEEENTGENASEENATEETAEEAELKVFNGEYVSAIAPDGWLIVEYENGDGSEMLVDGVTYAGLTGIKISNGSKEVMKFEAVSGIGFVGCPEIPLFDDSSAAYKQEQETMNEEVGMDLTTVDYTDAEYSEFKFLGKTVRRVDTRLYYDTVVGNAFFEPQCERDFMTLKGLSFVDSYDYKGEAYEYTISDSSTDAELLILDGILASITAE
ncbi:MAG: hypothetical protein AB9915_01805 [Candidatus Dojkabacteria bacterium]